MNTDQVNIIGAGGLGREVASMLPACKKEFGSYFDDNFNSHLNVYDIRSISSETGKFLIAIGDSVVRKVVFQRLPEKLSYATLIHPSGILQDSNTIRIGNGSIITAGTILTCDINISAHCIINLNCTVGHEVSMGDFCSLMPAVNLGGGVKLGECVYIGTGATLLPGITVGDNVVIGAGAVVTKDVPPGSKVAGVPAKPI